MAIQRLSSIRGPEASSMIRSLLKAQASKFKSVGLPTENFRSSIEPTNLAEMMEEAIDKRRKLKG